jgi:UDP-N-acetylglucosamine--N-acetylmuramyl-(pentapeptide) pyrophosphoryl-undecaprenol N-acetylglucosamine transferase
MRVLITGGGTGGHVYPALAIAEALRKVDPAMDIQFIGARGKLEMEKVPKAGYKIKGLPIAGIQRRLTWKNLLVPFKIMASLWASWMFLRKFNPDVAIGVGGYASGPALRVAAWLGIPYLLQEQNSYPGITNRLLAKKARWICIAWPGLSRFFPGEKLVVTGNPLRSNLISPATSKDEAKDYFHLSQSRKTILLLGGSLGARSLNEAVIANFIWWQQKEDIQLLWQCGMIYKEQCFQSATGQLDHVSVHPFIDRMDMAYAAADVIIARAGALTIAELCQLGKPVILVPSPNVAENHQTSNAKVLANVNAALMVPDKHVKTDLFPLVEELLADPVKMNTLSEKIREFAKPYAADEIAQLVCNYKTWNV